MKAHWTWTKSADLGYHPGYFGRPWKEIPVRQFLAASATTEIRVSLDDDFSFRVPLCLSVLRAQERRLQLLAAEPKQRGGQEYRPVPLKPIIHELKKRTTFVFFFLTLPGDIHSKCSTDCRAKVVDLDEATRFPCYCPLRRPIYKQNVR